MFPSLITHSLTERSERRSDLPWEVDPANRDIAYRVRPSHRSLLSEQPEGNGSRSLPSPKRRFGFLRSNR